MKESYVNRSFLKLYHRVIIDGIASVLGYQVKLFNTENPELFNTVSSVHTYHINCLYTVIYI